MIGRPFWLSRVHAAWREAPIAWLSGVRRSGKTTLAQAFDPEEALVLDCELPSVVARLADPELFLRDCRRPLLVLDEVHRLPDPSRFLKIGADHFPRLKFLATGSSTLAATDKFRDSLTGRKRQVHLLPVLLSELPAFSDAPLAKRLLHGGLPSALLAAKKSPSFYREWVDSYFARDVQTLFKVRGPERFTALFEYLHRQSGGLHDASKTSSALGVSRVTVGNYLRAMEVTQTVTVLRPFSGGHQRELVKAPKIYGFDTGFVSFFKGWDSLRPADCGVLWEHLALESFQALRPDERLLFWRDKAGREVDFVLPRGRGRADAFECKWDPAEFDPAGLLAFRALHPHGKNFLVTPTAATPYQRRVKALEVTVCSPAEAFA